MEEINDESLVLSAFVKQPNLVLNYLFPEQVFSSVVNEKLYKNIVSIAQEIKNPDFSVLVSTLKAKGLLDICGGESYLVYLRDLSIEVDNLDLIVDNLINNYKKRRFLNYVSNFQNVDFPSSSVNYILDRTIEEISNISTLSSSDRVLSLSDASDRAFDSINYRMSNKNLKTSGFVHIDAITGGLFPGDLWYVAGRPGMGKTAWCLNAINKQINDGIPVLFFSLEMAVSSLVYRLLAIRTGIPIIKLKLGILTKKELDILYEEKEKLSKLPLYIDTHFDSDIQYILSTINRQYNKNGIQIVHIDYVQLIGIADIDNAVREYTKISRALKVIANKLGISIIGYSQLTRNVENRNDKRPLLHDLRESGGFEQDADVVIVLYRDEVYNPDTKDKGKLENIIRKHREGELGVLFSKFTGETNKIEEEL
ncbi:MAG: DnaB-like helicase C-terminal domain-containing protein [Candidatus Micrarchaeia archaeon]